MSTAQSRHETGGTPPSHPRNPGGTAERAVLVALEFTGQRRKLTAAARLARSSARVADGAVDLDEILGSAGTAAEPEEQAPDLDFEASLAEFEELARSAGAEIAATIIQRRPRPDAATLVGLGKLEEIEGVIASTGADVVLFDHDLSPSQLRNLDNRLPCRVIDRTQLILDIFARHARTREGQLQVELAQLEYQLPRLAGRGKAMSQLGGGIGTRGPGETQLETDRRKINLRIDHVKEQLEAVRRIRRQQRQRREAVPVPVVALVGYTNAGKSTLFNALTSAGALESSRMFATLDPKLRQLQLPSRRKILLSDTVGFIRNLPHTLVTSFRATLEEVERAEILLHVRDASSESLEEQKAQVEKVLAELDIAGKPVIEVLNKIDRVPVAERVVPAGAVAVSGLTGEGLDGLLAAIDRELVVDPLVERRFRVPQAEGAALAALEAGAIVAEKNFEGNLAYFRAVGPASLLNRYRRFHVRGVGADAENS
ncbi:GTPase HflX [Granulicella sp. WH15]|uniref:GTPase HflX n=1 Tax=Granulicella sp. WH15 TaxID=2602070 RepID=UPI0013674E93|nr:GTPase HflX [Granulicella sp. WH15]QHN04558.1 GTPase HflX [Granulicella sp. WH15]